LQCKRWNSNFSMNVQRMYLSSSTLQTPKPLKHPSNP
jgi:hypothetical protein